MADERELNLTEEMSVEEDAIESFNKDVNDRETIIKDGRELIQSDAHTSADPSEGGEEGENNNATENISSSPKEEKSKRIKKKGKQSKKSVSISEASSFQLTSKTTPASSSTVATTSGALRVLGGGLKGSSLPLVLNMSGAPNTGGLSLLPAGLPPGRYVILPSNTSSVPSVTSISATVTTAQLKTGTSTVTTCSTKQISTYATGGSTSIFPAIASAPALAKPNYFAGRVGRPSKTSSQRNSGLRKGGVNMRAYSRPIRGRRKSYTAAEKLAMIEAVESGQKKSIVADSFGVAPSTLACILLQKHKIRCDQATDLSRRRLRHPRLLSPNLLGRSPEAEQLQKEDKDGNGELPFGAHFLSPLSASRQNIFDGEQAEEIVSIPDLGDRVSMEGPTMPMMMMPSDLTAGYTYPDTKPVVNYPEFDAPNDIEIKPEPMSEVDEEGSISNAGGNSHSSPPSRQSSPAPQGMTGPYLLKKETHCHNILDELLKDETYADVTLTAQGQTIKAHRIILSLSSKYFKSVLSCEPNAKNIIVFRDMKFQELKDIINFIYTGEVTVDASDLDSFMKTADVLEVTSLCNSHKKFPKGFNLSHNSTEAQELKHSPAAKRSSQTMEASPPPPKVRKTDETKQSKRGSMSSNLSSGGSPEKIGGSSKDDCGEDPFGMILPIQADCVLSDVEEEPRSKNKTGPQSCIDCCSSFENVSQMFQHMEETHETEQLFPCESCIQIFLTSKLFNKHKKNCQPKS